jgi:hypothetical protein
LTHLEITCEGEQEMTYGIYCKICGTIFVDRQRIDCSGYEQSCHDVGLRKQHLGYHNRWDFWHFVLLAWCGYCTVLMLAVPNDGRWTIAAK